MTHRQGVAEGRAIAARWRALAEQRLAHLTDMFESGRWRRYHSEAAFLENIQEAKRALQAWRALADGEDVPAMNPGDAVALGWTPAKLWRAPLRREQTVQPKAIYIDPQTSEPVEPPTMPDLLTEMTEAPVPLQPDPPAATAEPLVEFTLSLDGIEAKYPLLRNAF